MTDIAIRVENLSKQYRIGGPQARYKTIRESLTEAVQSPFRRLSSVVRGQSSAASTETLWALKDVSFEVQRGEVVGIPSLRQAQYKRQAQDKHWPQRGFVVRSAERRGRLRLLRQAQYKAQGSIPHHRADRGLRRDFVVSSVERSTTGWVRCWRCRLEPAERWALVSTPN